MDSQNPLYLAYRDPGLHLTLVLPAVIYFLLALIGIPMNASVCYITLKYRKTHSGTIGSNTGLLLAINCFFEVLHQFSHFCFLAIAITGTNFIPVRWSILLEGFPLIGFLSVLGTMFMLSLDRLLAISMPIFYRNLNQPLYIIAHLFCIFGMNFRVLYNIITATINFPNWPMTGFIGEFFVLPGIDNYNYVISWIQRILTIIFYVLVGVFIRFRTNVTSERMQRLYRSLFLIVVVNVGGYFLADLYNVVIKFLFQLSGIQIWMSAHFTGFLLNIAAISNGFILYSNSNEYKKAYQKEFAILRKKFFGNSHEVHSGNSVQQQRGNWNGTVVVNVQASMRISA